VRHRRHLKGGVDARQGEAGRSLKDIALIVYDCIMNQQVMMEYVMESIDQTFNAVLDFEEDLRWMLRIVGEQEVYMDLDLNGYISEDFMGDYDGDGILDAEELAPAFCHVNSIISLNFPIPPFNNELKLYGNTWPVDDSGNPIYHNIENWQTRTINPMDADTDGDMVPDGVEISDNNYELGRTDAFGNPIGYWPDEAEYNFNDYTDPLNPNRYNPSELPKESSTYLLHFIDMAGFDVDNIEVSE